MIRRFVLSFVVWNAALIALRVSGLVNVPTLFASRASSPSGGVVSLSFDLTGLLVAVVPPVLIAVVLTARARRRPAASAPHG